MQVRHKTLTKARPAPRPRPGPPLEPRRRRGTARRVLDRSRGVAPQPADSGYDDAVDWDALPVHSVLDGDFDWEDEEVTLGRARSTALGIREEEDDYPA
jgi:hypothetical protein